MGSNGIPPTPGFVQGSFSEIMFMSNENENSPEHTPCPEPINPIPSPNIQAITRAFFIIPPYRILIGQSSRFVILEFFQLLRIFSLKTTTSSVLIVASPLDLVTMIAHNWGKVK